MRLASLKGGRDGRLVTAGREVQPAATNRAFVKSKGAAINSSTLKIIAKTIELAAAAVPPFLMSCERPRPEVILQGSQPQPQNRPA